MSDFQHIQHILDDVILSEEVTANDGHKLGPSEVHEYLSRVMYSRRSKMNPLWNSILVGGFKDGERCVNVFHLELPLYSMHVILFHSPASWPT